MSYHEMFYIWNVISMNCPTLRCFMYPIYEMAYIWNVLFMKCPIYEMSYLWNVLSLKCPIHEMSSIWNVLFMKCLIYEMSYLWNVPFMKSLIFEMSCLWFCYSWNSPVWNVFTKTIDIWSVSESVCREGDTKCGLGPLYLKRGEARALVPPPQLRSW